MIFNIIGAGRLGKHLARALTSNGQASPGGFCNKHLERAKLAVEQIGGGIAVKHVKDLPAVELTFITTPDDSIAMVVADLQKTKLLSAGHIVVHCSGVLSSSVLTPLRAQGCHIASFHPLKAFREGPIVDNALRDCHCVLEGDREALAILTPIFKSMGAHLMTINPDKKASYHAAAVMSSNYLVTLAANAADLFLQAGMTAIQAKEISVHLMQGSLDNIRQAPDMAGALTGPLVRGDIATIRQHLKALNNPQTRALYEAAAIATLSLTRLDEKTANEIIQLLLSRHPHQPD